MSKLIKEMIGDKTSELSNVQKDKVEIIKLRLEVLKQKSMYLSSFLQMNNFFNGDAVNREISGFIDDCRLQVGFVLNDIDNIELIEQNVTFNEYYKHDADHIDVLKQEINDYKSDLTAVVIQRDGLQINVNDLSEEIIKLDKICQVRYNKINELEKTIQAIELVSDNRYEENMMLKDTIKTIESESMDNINILTQANDMLRDKNKKLSKSIANSKRTRIKKND